MRITPESPGNNRKKAEKGIPVFGLRIKNIKKRIKRSRRPVWSLGIWAALIASAAVSGTMISRHYVNVWFETAPSRGASQPVWSDNLPVSYDPDHSRRSETLNALSRWKGDVEVVLHRMYLCGEETRQLGKHTAGETMDLLKAHREWSPAFDAGRIVLEESVDDLSPQCRQSAYIGISPVGYLELFEGPPQKKKVIRTFFQLDVKSLESSLSKEKLRELANGIRISDKAEYDSVLSTFSDFALPKAADVLNQDRGE